MTGTARRVGRWLILKTQRKRGKKYVDYVSIYLVEDTRPDPRVADPAFTLTKVGTETVWHVGVTKFGPVCDCPSALRGPGRCKHAKGLMAVGLLK